MLRLHFLFNLQPTDPQPFRKVLDLTAVNHMVKRSHVTGQLRERQMR